MGLEEFMGMGGDESEDDDSSDETTPEMSQTKPDSPLLEFDNYYRDEDGHVRRRGPYGYESREEYEKTIVGEIELGQKWSNTRSGLFKAKLPVFTHITQGEGLEVGSRYKVVDGDGTCACITSEHRALGRINRELIMLDTGQAEKPECLDVLEERFGERPEASTEVVLNVLVNTQHAAKIGMANKSAPKMSTHFINQIIDSLFWEERTQEFREKDHGRKDIKMTDEINFW